MNAFGIILIISGIIAFLALVVWLALRSGTTVYEEGEIAEDMLIGGTTMGRAVASDMIGNEIIAETKDLTDTNSPVTVSDDKNQT